MTPLHIATLSGATPASSSTDARAPHGDATRLLQQFADRSPCAFWILDVVTMRLRYGNPAFSRLLGEAHGAVRDVAAWQARVHPEDRHARSVAIARLQRGDAFAHDYRIVKAGRVHVIRETCFSMGPDADSVFCAGGICEDVTTEDAPTVYLVDTPADGDVHLRALRAGGYEVRRFDRIDDMLALAPLLLPGCLVLHAPGEDAAMPGAVAALRAVRADMPLVMLGDCRGDVGVAVDAMKAGAVDFLQTPVAPQALLGAVAASLGRVVDTPAADSTVALTKAHVAAMTLRERQVLDGLLASGTNKSIGRDLGLSPRTVEAHRSRIMSRLGARSLAEAVLMMAAAGVVTLPGDAGGLGTVGDRHGMPASRSRPR